MSNAPITTAVVTFTDNAVAHLKKQAEKQGFSCVVRLYVKTAGCSGLQYKFDFVEAPLATDVLCHDAAGVTIYVDKKAVPFLQGTEIDYVKQGFNSQFQFNNPQQKGSCGCGESFYVE